MGGGAPRRGSGGGDPGPAAAQRRDREDGGKLLSAVSTRRGAPGLGRGRERDGVNGNGGAQTLPPWTRPDQAGRFRKRRVVGSREGGKAAEETGKEVRE